MATIRISGLNSTKDSYTLSISIDISQLTKMLSDKDVLLNEFNVSHITIEAHPQIPIIGIGQSTKPLSMVMLAKDAKRVSPSIVFKIFLAILFKFG